MRLTLLRGGACADSRTCPAAYRTESGSLVIVGRVVTDEGLLAQVATGPGEVAVEVPAALLPEVGG